MQNISAFTQDKRYGADIALEVVSLSQSSSASDLLLSSLAAVAAAAAEAWRWSCVCVRLARTLTLTNYSALSLPGLIRGSNVCIWLQQLRISPVSRRCSWRGGILLPKPEVNNAARCQQPISKGMCWTDDLLFKGEAARSRREWDEKLREFRDLISQRTPTDLWISGNLTRHDVGQRLLHCGSWQEFLMGSCKHAHWGGSAAFLVHAAAGLSWLNPP